MLALDTDLASLVNTGDPAMQARLAAIPPEERTLPVVVVEEIFRGRLAAIRAAASVRDARRLVAAYDLLTESVMFTRGFEILPYTLAAETLFEKWRKLRIRIGVRDLRIAAICSAAGVTMATRNARDFALVPGLTFAVWA